MLRVVSTSRLAPDCLHKSEQPIRSQISKLTQVLTLTSTHKYPRQGYVFFVLGPTNPFRLACYNFINHSVISNFILVCIMISSASLAAEDPLDSNSKRNRVLGYFDYFFTTIFTLEITIKVISYGSLQRGGYCRSPANLLDILVVGVSLASIIFSSSAGAVSVLKIIRVFRVLRPLRAINRAKGLKTVIQAVIVSVSSIQGWKMSCSHCQELCQQASWLLIGCRRVNNQSEARTAS